MTNLASPVWSEVDRGLQIGEADGNYMGMVVEADGGFVARNFRGATIGTFPTAAAARGALSPEATEARYRRDQFFAVATGSVSALTLVVLFCALMIVTQ